MKNTIALILLAASLTGCGSRDARSQKQMIGGWAGDGLGKITLASDSSYVFRQADGVTYQGTWTVQNGEYIATLTNCIADGQKNLQPLGSVARSKIVTLDEHHLVLETETGIKGQTITLIR